MEPKTPLFIILSLAVFAFLNFGFPLAAQQALQTGFTAGAGGAYGLFYLVLWLVGSLLAVVLCYLLFAWAFRQLAELTDSMILCRIILVAGALLTAGHLLIGLWGGFNTTGTNSMLPRLELTAVIIAVCGAAVVAVRYGPDPFYYDYTEYQS